MNKKWDFYKKCVFVTNTSRTNLSFYILILFNHRHLLALLVARGFVR